MEDWRPRLQPWRDDPQSAGVLLDFDGTLSAIVAVPEEARPLPGVVDLLAALVERYRLVAVVSGRPAAFLAEFVPVEGLVRWGLYGLEEVTTGGAVEAVADAERWRQAVAGVVERARAQAPPGVGVEDKGLTVTLHTRTAPAEEEWVAGFAAEEATRTGLAVHPAKMSMELRPPLALDKGVVVTRLLDGSGVRAACYVGDDIGDLPAFAAVGAAEVSLRVAVRSDEVPAELLAAADVTVDGPGGVIELLTALA